MRLVDADALLVKYSDILDCEIDHPKYQDTVREIIENAPTVQQWIPITYHYITDEEREENDFPEHWWYFLDCEMPSDGQHILVQTIWDTISEDWCYEEDGFVLDSGRDWIDDIVAWRPMPDRYRGEKKDD